jgi:hypothetical protein
MIQGIKKCSKIKVLEIARKQIHCVDLVLTIPTKLERAQTESVWLRYRVLSVFTNMQNVDCAVPTGHVEVDRTTLHADVER